MIKNYNRPINAAEKKRLTKKNVYIKESHVKLIKSILLKIFILSVFSTVTYMYFSLWLFIPILMVSFFMIWLLSMQVKDVIQNPKNVKNIQEVINSGIVEVTEIHIDRYIKIDNYNDEGNHFIVEYNGMLSLIGGQEFLGVRKLNNKIEHIVIMDVKRTGIYDEKIKKSGNAIEAYYIFKKGVSDALFNSELWDNLTSREPFSGKLEALDVYITEDKSKR